MTCSYRTSIVSTKRSAFPFDCGLYGEIRKCWISFFLQNVANCIPLSETMVVGTLNRANNSSKNVMTATVVGERIMLISGHMEKASITTSKCRPLTGPAKSIWIRSQVDCESGHDCTSEGSSSEWCNYRTAWHDQQWHHRFLASRHDCVQELSSFSTPFCDLCEVVWGCARGMFLGLSIDLEAWHVLSLLLERLNKWRMGVHPCWRSLSYLKAIHYWCITTCWSIGHSSVAPHHAPCCMSQVIHQ